MNDSLLMLAGAWLAYFGIHSLLAADAVKAFLIRQVPGNGRWYRLFYNLMAAGLLIPLAWWQITAPAQLFWPALFSAAPGGVLLVAGGWIGREAFRSYDTAAFLGFRHRNRDWDATQPLVMSAWHERVRHPLYFATILIAVGLFLTYPTDANLVALSCVLLYLWVGTTLEEKKLVRQFGERYLSYRRQVPMLLPLGRNKKASGPVEESQQ